MVLILNSNNYHTFLIIYLAIIRLSSQYLINNMRLFNIINLKNCIQHKLCNIFLSQSGGIKIISPDLHKYFCYLYNSFNSAGGSEFNDSFQPSKRLSLVILITPTVTKSGAFFPIIPYTAVIANPSPSWKG